MRTTAMTAPWAWKNEDFFLEIIMHDGTKACILQAWTDMAAPYQK